MGRGERGTRAPVSGTVAAGAVPHVPKRTSYLYLAAWARRSCPPEIPSAARAADGISGRHGTGGRGIPGVHGEGGLDERLYVRALGGFGGSGEGYTIEVVGSCGEQARPHAALAGNHRARHRQGDEVEGGVPRYRFGLWVLALASSLSPE
jgi:hypothetical protein